MVARKKEKKIFGNWRFGERGIMISGKGRGLFFYFPTKKSKEEVLTITNDTKIVCVCTCSGRPSAGTDTQR